MSNFNPVKPGDLITAAYFNQVLGSFDSRITALESAAPSGGQIVIQQLLPLGSFYVGNQMHVVGQNFGVPANVVVTIGGQQVTTFAPGSGNTDLYFDIPPVQGLAQAGSLVSLVIDTPTSPAPATTSFTLSPMQQTSPTGTLLISMTGPPTAATNGTAIGTNGTTAGNSYTYIFTVKGQTTLADNYSVTATLDTSSQSAGWTAVPVDPTSQNPITSISIPEGNTTTLVGVKVTIPAAAAAASVAQAGLKLASSLPNSLNPGVSGGGGTSVTVGGQVAPPNPISLTIYNVIGGTKSADGSSATVNAGATSATVIFQAYLPDGGSSVFYAVSSLTFDDSSWSASLVGPNPIQNGTADATVQIRFSITVGKSSTNMHLTVTENGKPSVQGQQAFPISLG